MRDQLILLFELQELDSKLHSCGIQLDEIPRQAQETKTLLDQTQGTLTEALTRQDVLDRDRRKAENDLAMEKEKLRKWEARLNEIRNSREFAALSREIEGLKRQNRDGEERILELMQQAEELTAEVTGLSEQCDQQRADYEKYSASADEETSSVRALVAKDQVARDAVAGRIKPNILKKYDTVRKQRAGIGLVLVVEGTCQGCHIQLPPQLYNELQRGDVFEACPNCNRILFWEPLAHRTTEDQAGIQP